VALARAASARPLSERRAVLERAAELLTRAGNYRGLALAYSNAAFRALTENDTAEAMSLLDAAVRATQRFDSPSTMTLVLGNVGLANLFLGDLHTAREALQHQLQLCRQHVFRYDAGEGLTCLAALSASEHGHGRAARLRGAARAIGYPATALDKHIDDRLEREYFNPAQARYGLSEWRHAEEVGASLSLEQAIALALEPTTNQPAAEETERDPGWVPTQPGSLRSTPES
jgi:hypothetical protein